MTATLLARGSQPPPGPRERRRLQQQHRRRRRYRRAAVVAIVAVAVALAAAGVGLRVAGPPAGQGDASEGDAGEVAPVAERAPQAPEAASETESRVDGAGEEPGGHPAGAESPVDPGAKLVRLQLLNGVGTPGTAARAEQRLPEDEFRVVVADNAPEFGQRKTRILVYSDDASSLAAAERLRDLLGAGTISVSRQPQSVVDATVIVGSDFDG